MIPIAYAVLYGIEMTALSRDRASLQAAADAGALAGAGELGVTTRQDVGIAETAVRIAMGSSGLDARVYPEVFTAAVDRTGGTVTVTGSYARQAIFGDFTGGSTTVEVTAIAESLSQTPLCVLQTEVNTSYQTDLQNTAIIRAPGCLVQANSSIRVANSARLEAGKVLTAGSASGSTITPAANVGALAIDDPFAGLDLNPPTPCPNNPADISVSGNQTYFLNPGVHCGEIKVSGNAILQLNPGEHYFEDEVDFNGNASIRGDDVVLIFGDDESFNFGDRAQIELTARKTGPLAGFLIATSRDNYQRFRISPSRVRELLGTIYIPNAELQVSAAGSVAEDSAWSVIVARRLTLSKNPVLVINKNYAGSGVPVPTGVGPRSGKPRLSR